MPAPTPQTPSHPPPHPAAAPAPLSTALRLLLPLAVVLLVLAVVLGGLAASARWLLATEGGTRWLLAALPGVQAEGVRGALLGEDFSAERLRITWNRARAPADIEGLELRGVAWRWRPQSELWIGLEIAQARARRVKVDTGAPSSGPLAVPTALVAPLLVRVARVEVAELRLNQFEPIVALAASALEFDGRPGQHHTIEQFVLRGYGVALGGRASVGNGAPLPLEASLTLTPTLYAGNAPPWAAVLRVSGPLDALDVTAVLRGVPRAGAAAPQAELEARVRPLAPWPVTALIARTEALDLSALIAGAPQTRLSGRIEASIPKRDAPVAASAQIENRLPGRWNEGRLPFSRIDFELSGTLDQRERIEAPRIEVQLADARGPAGRVSGRATWTGHRLEVDARVAGLMPQRLDSRAAAMTLSGPLQLRVDGLASPDPLAVAKARSPWQAEAEVDLEGKVEGAPTTVQVVAEGSAAANRIELRRLRVRAGAASAELSARLERRDARADWQLDTAGSLNNFDPLPWWPGEAGSAWRRGPHRVNADWQFDLRLPPRAGELAPLTLAQSLAGNGRLRIHESTLAGVPVSADIALGYTQAAAPSAGSLRADITLGGNRVQVEGRGNPTGSGDNDRWRAEVDAPALAALAPLARLHPVLADWVPRQGRASATLGADGRWPRLASEGQATLEQLRAGTLGVQSGTLRWRARIGPGQDDAPLELTAELNGLQLGNQRADQLRAELRGTLAEHRIELLGALPLAPPPLAEKLLGLEVKSGTRALLLAQGQWTVDGGGGGGGSGGSRWRARIERLAVDPWDGKAGSGATPNGGRWAEARDLRAELDFDRHGALTALRAEPGRLRLADTITLRWDEVRAELRGGRTDFALQADLEPFALAPLLARAQPTMGWQGDLRLGGRLAIKAAERFEADMVFERRDGDLHLGTSDGVRLFGLTQFRFALSARDGVWDFKPQFNGRSLGEISGTLRARTTPERRWPHADAPIEGQVQARVADIGIWGSWVPPGWRLVGELRTTAAVGGRFGAPSYTGELSGAGLGVRNLLQGVNVSDGQLRVVLAGDSARIEHFSAKGGDGKVEISGSALFGAKPSARLQMQAERFRVLGRVDRMLIASGRAELVLGSEASRLDGSLRVDEGQFDFSRADAPSLDNDVHIRGSDDDARPTDGAPAAARRLFTLAVDVDLGAKLRVRGRGVDTGLRGKLRVTNPAGRLALNGTVQAHSGTYAAYGQRLEIERGLIAFGGTLANPRLDILAIRPNLDTRVGVLIAGTAQAPRVRLYSEPEMGETDKLAWLLLGRAPDGLGRNDTAILQRAAVALLAGEGEAPTDSLMKNLGIDELSLRQSAGDVRETVITLGKQLSRRWYLGYERGVNSTTGTWQLIYRIAQRFTLRAQSGMENSLDLIWTWRLQETPLEGGVRKSLPATPP